jgi:hypothetical protein
MFVHLIHRCRICTIPALALAAFFASANPLLAGPYAPAAGKTGTTAVIGSDSSFIGWATTVVSYVPGKNVDSEWTDTSKCLGTPDEDGVYGITCLGNGGTITVSFAEPIANGDGWDFAVFENAFSAGFLELAYVEVSSDGVNFVRFPSHSKTASKVGAYSTTMDATNIDGLAGKYMLDYGTPFDLSDLADVDGADKVDLDAVTQVRLVDIIGDGSCKDSDGNPIYDPYPTTGSGGFDLDAVGVRYFQTTSVTESATVVKGVFIGIASGKVSISWTGSSGTTYEVQQSSDMKTWTKLRSGIAGADATITLSADMPTTATFYRVVPETEQ